MSSCGREPGSEESEDCLSAATGAEASVDENADLSKLEPLEFERDVETEDLLASQVWAVASQKVASFLVKVF